MKDLTSAMHDALHTKRVEPVQRLCGGEITWAIHRFPIKGGITLLDIMAINICSTSPLLQALIKKNRESA
jgi:hypothetical protein